MADKHLHIVTHDVPWPADYGGVIDLFYKLKALHRHDVKIHLHCFSQGRPQEDELNKFCISVTYYQRKIGISRFSFRLPFIVNSRANPELIKNLQKDNYPVLLEGIHCTYYLNKGELNNKKVIVRLHNTEFKYYRQLARHEKSLFKRLYFLHESSLLKKYEKNIAKSVPIFAVSKQDAETYKQAFASEDIHYLPVFLPYSLAAGKEGNGCFCLYHGNLSVSENEEAAIWLLQKVFNNLTIPFVIAGKNPSKRLQMLAHRYQHTCLVINPSQSEMQDLIAKAHIHVLPSLNNTGIKLKLFNALFNGRHCLVNQAGVIGSGLEEFCHIADDAVSFQKKIQELYTRSFAEEEIERRQGILQTTYNNEANARQLMTFLW